MVTPGDDATWLYAFTAAWAGMPAELIDACYPPAVAEQLYGAKNKEFSCTVSRRALMVCPRGDSNTRHAV